MRTPYGFAGYLERLLHSGTVTNSSQLFPAVTRPRTFGKLWRGTCCGTYWNSSRRLAALRMRKGTLQLSLYSNWGTVGVQQQKTRKFWGSTIDQNRGTFEGTTNTLESKVEGSTTKIMFVSKIPELFWETNSPVRRPSGLSDRSLTGRSLLESALLALKPLPGSKWK